MELEAIANKVTECQYRESSRLLTEKLMDG